MKRFQSTTQPPQVPLARQAREHFVAKIEEVLPGLADAIRGRLADLVDASASARDSQERRDNLLTFDQKRRLWTDATAKSWRRALMPPTATARVRLEALNLELIGDDVVENKILSSRLALAIGEKATWQLNDLKVRMQHLENDEELSSQDILRPEAIAQHLVEQWSAAGLSRGSWQGAQDVIHKALTEKAVAAYESLNAFLVERGVMPEIDLSGRVKRTANARPSGPGGVAGEAPQESAPGDAGVSTAGSAGGTSGGGQGGFPGGGQAGVSGSGGYGGPSAGGAPSGGGSSGAAYATGGGGGGGGGGGAQAYAGPAGGGGASQGGGYSGGGGAPQGGGYSGGGASQGGGYAGGPSGGAAGGGGAFAGGGMAGGAPGGRAGPASAYGGRGGVHDETRLLTGTTPLARARMRATGVIGQLKRLLTDKANFNIDQAGAPASPALQEAIGHHTQMQSQVATRMEAGATVQEVVVYDDAAVERVAVDLRDRTTELKKKASTQSEKATIEIVALMFQSILSEERIPPAVRVWFARLQMPVLRVALAEPEFFGTLQHPARQLIDRMGSCVLGFNSASIGGSALEMEIKRIVQVIEQYPETGRRVFQLVYDEFQKFLSKFLTEKGDTQRLVSVAQQVEQKETLAVQYTIELRKMLNDVPVRDEIREFLFKVWAEVLAVAAIKHGVQHTETVALKKSAADLVWSASAKPNRTERARVIQDLPQLLQRLRSGMTLLGLAAADQERHIKVIGDTLADAFMSKTESIPQAQIDAMTKRLANLEDFVSDDPGAELPLDSDAIEMMLGIDASSIEVVTDGGSNPSDAMMAWAKELQQGTWFTLDHNGKQHQVQYVWRSDRGQLHLLASTDGKSFLIQARRLASYLQAGLLLPAEEEALTVRATRDALAKLDANPERLLA
ncbi:DUF1631 family protein [Ramlibacter algicola]|uniref:DUF1631 domain-containing protein n=1 Tax=Ramlibacter algicola TaxID=2795217 RepID=A0A934UPM3_9BURK|nr:DUF1631 domain-containing protein [Ramlibacter algicola]